MGTSLHIVHYRSLSLTIAAQRSEAQRSAAVVEMKLNFHSYVQIKPILPLYQSGSVVVPVAEVTGFRRRS